MKLTLDVTQSQKAILNRYAKLKKKSVTEVLIDAVLNEISHCDSDDAYEKALSERDLYQRREAAMREMFSMEELDPNETEDEGYSYE